MKEYEELIEALQCASHFALYQDCYERNCYANSGKELYCNIPKLMADAADALEAAEKRIVELNAKCANLQSQINEMENEIEELMPKRGEWAYGKTNYCTNCGAKMDGKEQTDADS